MIPESAFAHPELECDVVISPRPWQEMEPTEIQAMLRTQIAEAIAECFPETDEIGQLISRKLSSALQA